MVKEKREYNERIFSRGIRGFFHEARFKWLYDEIKRLNLNLGSVIELGCFDGKTINYLPFKPSCYLGFDANWEGGLDAGKELWKKDNSVRFKFCDKAILFNPEEKVFDYGIAMETLEHLHSHDIDEYLNRIRSSVKSYNFFTIPNEQGMLFLFKYLIKATVLKVDEPYKLNELWHAFTGNQQKVPRTEGGHKGFSYEKMIEKIENHFVIDSIKGIPFKNLPLYMNFTVGITAKAK